MLLQDAIEHFIERKWRVSNEDGNLAEQCMQALANYLLHYSDLYHEQVAESDAESEVAEEWEQQLEDKLFEMIEGEEETASWSLAGLESHHFEPSHIREFIGWYLPRMDTDTEQLNHFCSILKDWLSDMFQDKVITHDAYQDFVSVTMEMEPEAVRAMKVAQLLLHFVRWGSNASVDMKSQPFSTFVEGHARLSRIEETRIWWSFDDQEEEIGPVVVDQAIASLLQHGDVLNVQLGQRGEQWQMVDIGPLYPNSIYVEAESYDASEEVSEFTISDK